MNRPPDGYIWLSLSETPLDGFYLEIPTQVIFANCCILSRPVTIWNGTENLNLSDDNQALENRGVYEAHLEQGTDWYGCAVTLAAVNRSDLWTTTARREAFKKTILPRDKLCIFSDHEDACCQASHIIPFAKGNAWLTAINSGRHHNYSAAALVKRINDCRNGILLAGNVHANFDQKRVSIMKVPNNIISLCDVPYEWPDIGRLPAVEVFDKDVPKNCQYVIQWIVPPPIWGKNHLANNTVALFAQNIKEEHLPSPLLLDYHYGAAAIIHWGRKVDKLGKPDQVPEQVAPVPQGPTTKFEYSHELEAWKRRGKRKQTEDDQESGPSSSRQVPSHSHVLAELDASEPESSPRTPQQQRILYPGPGYQARGFTVEEAEELILGFWMSTPEARAERKQEANEKTSNNERWRKEVT